MEKEILTTQIIEKDLKKQYSNTLLGGLIFLPFYVLMAALFVFLLILFINVIIPNKIILNIISAVLYVILGLIYVQAFSSSIRERIKVGKGKFEILDDWVVDKLPARHGRYSHRPNTLVFARSGEYGIVRDLNYEWSDLYCMSNESVYNSAKIDDGFYVISVGKKKCVLAYNKKMFELQQ